MNRGATDKGHKITVATFHGFISRGYNLQTRATACEPSVDAQRHACNLFLALSVTQTVELGALQELAV